MNCLKCSLRWKIFIFFPLLQSDSTAIFLGRSGRNWSFSLSNLQTNNSKQLLKMNIFVIPASQKWLAESCISLWIKEWRFTCWHSSYYGSVLKPLLKKKARHCFQWICLHILGRRFRRVGDNILLMRDIEVYLQRESAKGGYRINWLTSNYKARYFLAAILPRGISRQLLPKLVWQ